MTGPFRGEGKEGNLILICCPGKKEIYFTKDDISKYPYSSVHVKFCCRSAKSLSFNWFVEIQ